MPTSEAQVTVSLVIPTWQRRDLVLRLLDLLETQTRRADEVIVVDNGSTDGTAEAVGARATVLRLDRNCGFAHAVNLGIQAARGEWVGIVNNDVEPKPDWLKILSLSKSSFVTGKLLNLSEPHLLDGTYDLLSQVAMPWRAGSGRRDQSTINYNNRIQFASWTAALYRRDVFQRVGLLDEAFGSYYEDVDFGLRCAQAGIIGEYEPKAVALHAGSSTFGAWRPETVRLLTRNHRLLIKKHFGPQRDWSTSCRLFVSRVLWAILALRHGQLAAWWAGCRESLPEVRYQNDPALLRNVLQESEAELYRLQNESGFDWYWRMYFKLFPLR